MAFLAPNHLSCFGFARELCVVQNFALRTAVLRPEYVAAVLVADIGSEDLVCFEASVGGWGAVASRAHDLCEVGIHGFLSFLGMGWYIFYARVILRRGVIRDFGNYIDIYIG